MGNRTITILETLQGLTVKEIEELSRVLKEEYGITPIQPMKLEIVKQSLVKKEHIKLLLKQKTNLLFLKKLEKHKKEKGGSKKESLFLFVI